MRKAIRCEADRDKAIFALYGMGSFFRGEATYRDVDLVVVIACPQSDLVAAGNRIRASFDALGERLDVAFDLTILTPREFASRPLRDMDSLELLFSASSRSAPNSSSDI